MYYLLTPITSTMYWLGVTFPQLTLVEVQVLTFLLLFALPLALTVGATRLVTRSEQRN